MVWLRLLGQHLPLALLPLGNGADDARGGLVLLLLLQGRGRSSIELYGEVVQTGEELLRRSLVWVVSVERGQLSPEPEDLLDSAAQQVHLPFSMLQEGLERIQSQGK